MIALCLINLVGAFFVGWAFLEAREYYIAKSSFTAFETTYLTALWTRAVAYAAALIAFDVACGLIALVHQTKQTTELLAKVEGTVRATIPTALEPPPPPPPPPPRHDPRVQAESSSAVVRSAAYRGFSYDVHQDGTVSALLAGRRSGWASEEIFKSWADDEIAPRS